MKKALITAIFVFSVVLNLAVAGTLGWHYWQMQGQPAFPSVAETKLTDDDFKFIRKQCMGNGPGPMRELRGRIKEKRTEVLDLLAASPGNPEAAEPKIGDLVELTGQMERQAAARISKVMAALPDEKRQEFLAFLKARAAFGPGMGFGRGMGHGRGKMGPWHRPSHPRTESGEN
jgi:uncharacterized membrane protein